MQLINYKFGETVGVEVIRQSEGSDPAAVVYDAINAAKNKGVDILICDTGTFTKQI